MEIGKVTEITQELRLVDAPFENVSLGDIAEGWGGCQVWREEGERLVRGEG